MNATDDCAEENKDERPLEIRDRVVELTKDDRRPEEIPRDDPTLLRPAELCGARVDELPAEAGREDIPDERREL